MVSDALSNPEPQIHNTDMWLTTLKKICRTAQVTRWPFRKRTSIERLIHRTQYFMTDGDDLEQKIAELQCLLAQREGLKVPPNVSHQQQMTITFDVYICSHTLGDASRYEDRLRPHLCSSAAACITMTVRQYSVWL